MSYRVFFDRILVRRDGELANETGILMPHDVKKPPKTGTVLRVGAEVKYLKVNDRVIFSEYSGYYLQTTQELSDPDLIVMREDEVLAVDDEDELDG